MPTKFARGELIIKVSPESHKLISTTISKTSDKLVVPRFGIRDLDKILDEFGVTEISRVRSDIFLIRMPLDIDLDEAKNKLSSSNHIKDVDFNYVRYIS